MQFKVDGSIIPPFFSIYSVFTNSACFNADWGRGGSLLESTLHFSVSTTKRAFDEFKIRWIPPVPLVYPQPAGFFFLGVR